MIRIVTREEYDDFVYQKELDKIVEDIDEEIRGCRERGYHRVQQEPEKGEPTFCYDCSYPVWHPDMDIGNLPYRVEPIR